MTHVSDRRKLAAILAEHAAEQTGGRDIVPYAQAAAFKAAAVAAGCTVIEEDYDTVVLRGPSSARTRVNTHVPALALARAVATIALEWDARVGGLHQLATRDGRLDLAPLGLDSDWAGYYAGGPERPTDPTVAVAWQLMAIVSHETTQRPFGEFDAGTSPDAEMLAFMLLDAAGVPADTLYVWNDLASGVITAIAEDFLTGARLVEREAGPVERHIRIDAPPPDPAPLHGRGTPPQQAGR